MIQTEDIVARLWRLCNILRESGITYPEYVTELTYLLFLKMAEETRSEDKLPRSFRWRNLVDKPAEEQFSFYCKMLKMLGTAEDEHVKEIFSGAKTSLKQARHLALLVKEFDKINWYSAREESALADVYEGLLEKNSSESKSGAGQYFTPRPLVDSIIGLVKPQAGETIQDPACGTAGFLIAADRYIKQRTNNLKKLTTAKARFQRDRAFVGVELVKQTHKLALMNAMLHGIHGNILQGDALGKEGATLRSADVIVTNPPFGTKPGAGLPDRSFPVLTSNKQLAFLQHIYLGLKAGGRAAVVLPDLQGNAASKVCRDLMNQCDLHTVLRLPTGIFYAQGVKTNVFFFTRGKLGTGNTKEVWIYDLRSNMPAFAKRTPLTRKHFAEFEKAFGNDPYGKSPRRDEGDKGRFRCFTREEIKQEGDTLDITWLVDGETGGSKNGKSPDALADQVMKRLEAALRELKALQAEVLNEN